MTSHIHTPINVPVNGNCLNCERYVREISRLNSEISLLKENIIKLSLDDHKDYTFDEIDEKEDYHLLDLTPDTLNDIIELHYTVQLFKKGQRGVAEFIANYIVKYKERYLCTDELRNIFTYTEIDEPASIKKDVKCKRLMDKIYPLLSIKISKIYRNLVNSSDDLEYDGYDSEIDEIIATAISYPKLIDTSKDEINDLYNIFIDIKKIKTNRQPIIDSLRSLPSYSP